jgi:hypothetical protein
MILCALWWNCQVSVLTYHNDLARTGANLHETLLTPSSVSSGRFGPLFTYPVDGQVYAQPLYMPGVIVPGKGIHNIVFVATEHDSVYAFDADNDLGAPLWHTSFLSAAQGVTAAQAADLECEAISPEVGITGTPVIDPATGTLYVVAMTEQGLSGQFVHRLHALDVATGAERPGSPVEIQASAPGAAAGNSTIPFEPWLYKSRAGLLLLNGTVYTSWSSHCDSGDYHGWIIGYRAWGYGATRRGTASLEQTAVFTSTPNAYAGAFWQSGAAPAADSNGSIYIVSGNGIFDASQGGSDFGESVLKLSTGAGFGLADYFTPYNADALSDQDIDLGSSGALLLPAPAGSAAHPRLLVTGSKAGTVYVLDRDNLGRFEPQGNGQIVQSLAGAVGPLYGIPSYFNNSVYFSAAQDQVKAFTIADGLLSAAPASISSSALPAPGSVPSISANGVADGIVWSIGGDAQLHAYDAIDLNHQLYQAPIGTFIKFSTPTVANGKVYVGTAASVIVYGLQDPAPASVTGISAADFRPGPVTAGSAITLFGSNLAPRAASASSTAWPKVLEDTSVFVNGIAAAIGYVSPTQINAQVPEATPPGRVVITVVTGGRVLPPLNLTVRNGEHGK